MKSKEELNAIKEEVEALNEKLAELNKEELEQITGSGRIPTADPWKCRQCGRAFPVPLDNISAFIENKKCPFCEGSDVYPL